MKLVMEFNSGGHCYESNSFVEVLCFEYESSEKLLYDFKNKLEIGLELKKEWAKYYNESSYNISNKNLSVEKWREKQPEGNLNYFEFLGHDFIFEDFETELPCVFDLEDWFQMKLEGKL